MLKTIHESESKVFHLPGRDWFYMIGPDNSPSRNLTFGLAEFPPDSNAAAHTHAGQEEIIYILSGEGQIVTPEETRDLLPGVAVFIPPYLEHRIAVTGSQPLRLVTLFSPPTVPGTYDPPKK
jgi:mannose-6-phosphate isomerase-like protein (cupin superfamily)